MLGRLWIDLLFHVGLHRYAVGQDGMEQLSVRNADKVWQEAQLMLGNMVLLLWIQERIGLFSTHLAMSKVSYWRLIEVVPSKASPVNEGSAVHLAGVRRGSFCAACVKLGGRGNA